MKKIGLIVFIFALVVGVVLASISSFGKISGRFFSFNIGGVKGSGSMKTETRDVSGFTAIDVSGAFEVEIVAQKDFSVEVEADDNLLELIKTEIDGDTLKIKSEKSIKSSNPLRIRISAPNIESLDLSGASKVNIVNLNNDSLSLDSSGASKIKLEGTTKNFDVEMSGASKLDAENLKAENVSVDSSGASSAYVYVTNELKVDLSGATNVTYSGSPKSVHKKASGASSVKEK
jgi:Putative auto-transporter adhesin, head GIN domain